ncbi:S16 family serine protease [Vibrio hippocampi]|uniref:endopeptidase La n=1 Tax=Vibrio hippocampi TaxID=654686 RepID=A0ABN8DJH6_9VIBR|nr:Lon protease family protein [Vibrio hippocampi]CAH0525994.1 Lon protease [Vibrio hippocampi]
MNPVSWQDVCPQYEVFNTTLDRAADIPPLSFEQLQPRLLSTLEFFCSEHCLSKVLVIKDGDNFEYRQMIADIVNRLGKKTVVSVDSDAGLLFDRYQKTDDGLEYATGLIHQADQGVLVAAAQTALSSLNVWNDVKTLLLGGALTARPLSKNQVSTAVSTYRADCKLIIVGERDQLAELDYADSDFRSGFMQYTEIEQDFKLTSSNLEQFIGFINGVTTKHFPDITLDRSAYLRLLQAGARLTEDKQYLPLSIEWLTALLGEASQYRTQATITAEHIETAICAKKQRESYLPQRAIEDILEGQVVIETKGKQVGQVNGLTVIEIPGHPISYGEPARISCVVHFGDGDVSDVERKVELGGNIHAKGMMIMQAFVSAELNLDAPLPYSASIVFEQSYCEVDGDSASLAELCSLVSALSGYPIDQQIAVTGAVDQFGRVQAVGGLNEKVEGFYNVCKHQGLSGKQGVILPKTNIQHLALSTEVVTSIQKGEFHIWPVSHVDEVTPLLLGKPFNNEEDACVINKIAERIDQFEKHHHSESWFDKIKALLSRDS